MKEYDKTYFAKRLDNIDFFLFAANLYHYVQDNIYHCMRIEIDIYGNQNHVVRIWYNFTNIYCNNHINTIY